MSKTPNNFEQEVEKLLYKHITSFQAVNYEETAKAITTLCEEEIKRARVDEAERLFFKLGVVKRDMRTTKSEKYLDATCVPYVFLRDTIDLKASQIDKLVQLRGAVLYATKKQYCLVFAKSIKEKGKLINSDRFGGKPVYRVNIDDLTWTYWVHRPEFKEYKYATKRS